jgi:tetratricopeptide (TPR) repeat protein
VKDDIGDYDGALADYNKAIEIDPESATAYFNRGNTHYRLGKKDEACIDWSKAKQLGDESAQQRLDDFCN